MSGHPHGERCEWQSYRDRNASSHVAFGSGIRKCNAWSRTGARGHARRRGEPPGRRDFSTLLALAQQQKASGRDFILGAVCGYEIGAAVGRAIMDQEMVRRFRPTGITGPLAGAIAGSRLLALDEDATVSALGFAANATGGLNEWPYCGGDEMFFHPGFAARNAVTAVELASLGARASESALDGRAGLFAGSIKRIASREWRRFPAGPLEILSVYYKPAPACNYAQTACQAALALTAAGRISEQRHRVDCREGVRSGGRLSRLRLCGPV